MDYRMKHHVYNSIQFLTASHFCHPCLCSLFSVLPTAGMVFRDENFQVYIYCSKRHFGQSHKCGKK